MWGSSGRTGPGKTTLLKCLLGIARPDKGTVRILDRDSRDRRAREDVGVVLDECLFHDTLLAKDVDKILSKVYRQWDKALFDGLLQRLKLPTNRYLKEFSRGMKMKLSLAARPGPPPQRVGAGRGHLGTGSSGAGRAAG